MFLTKSAATKVPTKAESIYTNPILTAQQKQKQQEGKILYNTFQDLAVDLFD